MSRRLQLILTVFALLMCCAALAQNHASNTNKQKSLQQLESQKYISNTILVDNPAKFPVRSASSISKIDPNEQIAQYTGKLANYTLALAKLTGLLVLIGIGQGAFLFYANRTASANAQAAKKAADVAEEALVASRRPWITFTPWVLKQIEERNGESFCTIRIDAKNVGESPAVNITPFLKFYSRDNLPPLRDVERIVREIFNTPINITEIPVTTLMATDSAPYPLEERIEVAKPLQEDKILAYALCAVAYDFTFGDRKTRYTANLYALMDAHDRSNRTDLMFQAAGDDFVFARLYNYAT